MRVGVFVAVAIVSTACGRAGFEPAPSIDGGDAAADGPLADALPVTDRHWVDRGLSAPGPLIGARAVFDRARGTVVLYGGDHGTGIPPTDPSTAMWEYDGVAWSVVCDPCAPGPRLAPALVYDTARDRIVLFGGFDTAGPRSDLWEWDGSQNGGWTKISDVAPPGPRGQVQAAYDERRHRTVVFGGGVDDARYDATVFEYDGTVWSVPATSGGPAQVGGAGAGATWNPVTQQIDVLEDHGRSGDSDAIWSWDGTAWRAQCTACTDVPRRDASLVSDPSPVRSYVIGGYSGAQNAELPGTWLRDATGTRLVSPLVAKRDSVAVVYDARRDVFVLYGGNGTACKGNCDETWELIRD